MGRETRQETREAGEQGRKRRVPLGRPRFKLDATKIVPAGKVARWVNDDPGRLQAAEDGGYTFVQDPFAHVGEAGENERDQLSTKVRRIVGSRKEGGAKTAYLMVIDEEIYEQDQVAKREKRQKLMTGLRRGIISGGLTEKDNVYIPKEGLQIDQQMRVPKRSVPDE